MIDINTQKIDGKCPKCNGRLSTSVEQIARNAIISCSSCGERIQLKDQGGSFRKAQQDIKRASNDLDKALKNLGRRLK